MLCCREYISTIAVVLSSTQYAVVCQSDAFVYSVGNDEVT